MIRGCLFLLVSLWIVWPNVGCAQFKIEGSYEVVDGLNGIFSGYQNMPLRSTRITFFDKSITINSGIYYYIVDQDQDSLTDRKFPFIYNGKRTSYLLSDDSIKFFYEPLEAWEAYGFHSDKDQILLTSVRDTLVLKKVRCLDAINVPKKRITSIIVKVDFSGSFQYVVNYMLELYPNDSLVYRSSDFPNGHGQCMQKGTFAEIEEELNRADLGKLAREYNSDKSDEMDIKLYLFFWDSSMGETKISGISSLPAAFVSPIVSIIFAHQKLMYKDCRPRRQPFLYH